MSDISFFLSSKNTPKSSFEISGTSFFSSPSLIFCFLVHNLSTTHLVVSFGLNLLIGTILHLGFFVLKLFFSA